MLNCISGKQFFACSCSFYNLYVSTPRPSTPGYLVALRKMLLFLCYLAVISGFSHCMDGADKCKHNSGVYREKHFFPTGYDNKPLDQEATHFGDVRNSQNELHVYVIVDANAAL